MQHSACPWRPMSRVHTEPAALLGVLQYPPVAWQQLKHQTDADATVNWLLEGTKMFRPGPSTRRLLKQFQSAARRQPATQLIKTYDYASCRGRTSTTHAGGSIPRLDKGVPQADFVSTVRSADDSERTEVDPTGSTVAPNLAGDYAEIG
jgi:hypothetical protein